MLKELLKYIGIDINGDKIGGDVVLEGASAVLYNFSLMVFIFSVISLLSVFNIIIYFIVINYADKSLYFREMCEKRKWFGRIVNYYKKSRLTFIVIEFLFFVMSTVGMIFLSFIVLTRYFV